MSVVQEEVIEGYFYFRARIKVLEKDPTKNPLIVVFKGRESHGKNWSPDCKILEDIFVRLLAEHGRSFPPESYLLKVKVGNSEAWSKEDCPFRTDRKIKLNNLPTVMAWNCDSLASHKKLEGKEECTLENLYNMFLPGQFLELKENNDEDFSEEGSNSSFGEHHEMTAEATTDRELVRQVSNLINNPNYDPSLFDIFQGQSMMHIGN